MCTCTYHLCTSFIFIINNLRWTLGLSNFRFSYNIRVYIYITFKFILFSIICFALKYTKVLAAEMVKSLYDGPSAQDWNLGFHKLYQGI